MNIQDLLKNKNHQINQFTNYWLSKSPQNFTVDDGIIVVDDQNDYAENFGLQWNEFQLTQFDSHSGLPLTEERLKECSSLGLVLLKNF